MEHRNLPDAQRVDWDALPLEAPAGPPVPGAAAPVDLAALDPASLFEVLGCDAADLPPVILSAPDPRQHPAPQDRQPGEGTPPR